MSEWAEKEERLLSYERKRSALRVEMGSLYNTIEVVDRGSPEWKEAAIALRGANEYSELRKKAEVLSVDIGDLRADLGYMSDRWCRVGWSEERFRNMLARWKTYPPSDCSPLMLERNIAWLEENLGVTIEDNRKAYIARLRALKAGTVSAARGGVEPHLSRNIARLEGRLKRYEEEDRGG